MGLDMYLTKKTYVQQWDQIPVDKQYAVTVTRGGKPTNIQTKRVKYVIEQVAYWCKANAIHAWFVRNVQGGNDDCGTYYVSEEQLKTLLANCEAVLADHALAETALPSQSGFFFGSTHYNDWYFRNLEETRDTIKQLLTEEGDGEYEYHSSW